MFYKVVNGFKDIQDNDHVYVETSIYPRDGYTPSEERIKELSSVHPKYKRVFIEKIEEEGSEPPKREDDGQKEEDAEKALSLLTEADLKKLNKDYQVKLIEKLDGNPDEAKNESERIALILSLQRKNQEQNEDNDQEPSPDK